MRTNFSNYPIYNLLTTIIYLISANGLKALAATLLGQHQVTRPLPIEVAYERELLTLGRQRDSWNIKITAELEASSFSAASRRLLQGSSPRKGLGWRAIIGLGFGVLLAIGMILGLGFWYLRKRRIVKRLGTERPKSTDYPEDEASPSHNQVTSCMPKYNFMGSRPACTTSRSAPLITKPKDGPRTPAPAFNGGFRRLKVFGLQPPPKPKIYLSSACEMAFSMLQAATDNFSEANLLGEGGSARVYKGKLRGGDHAAVKVIKVGGRNAAVEFQAEVDLMRQVRHPNLVSLLGYSELEDRHVLVYELMRNGSLEDQLYGPTQGTSLSWFGRIKIALDSARGLEYLHRRNVVHRDFKASNVLLDDCLNAKISDFGLATPLEGLTQEESLQLVGTIGYVAPEFFSSGTLTGKSDVYAFGVTLLELLTGRKPIDHKLPAEEQSLVNWAVPQLTDRNRLPKLVAAHVRGDMNVKHLYQVAAVAALCVQKEPSYRPLIGDVVQSLIPLLPAEMGGVMRSDSDSNSKNFAESSRSSSQRDQQPNIWTLRSESFTFAGKSANDPDLPPDTGSAASSVEFMMHATVP